MIITCAICQEIFVPAAEICVTSCGHVFHYVCLVHWIERMKTCPECRNRTTEKTIHKIYFNLVNNDNQEDLSVLQCKMDNLQFQLSLRDNEVKKYKEKYDDMKQRNAMLKQEMVQVEDKEKNLQSTIHALKERVAELKRKCQEVNRLEEDVSRLRHKLNEYQNVEVVLQGTKEQVDTLLRHTADNKQLALLVETLKKSLTEATRTKREYERMLREANNEATNWRKKSSELISRNQKLLQDIETHKNCDRERQYLKDKIAQLTGSSDDTREQNTSIQRIQMESPAPLPKTVKFINVHQENKKTDSPSVQERVKTIRESDSPYLNLKFSGVGLVGAKDKMSIFKTKPASATAIASTSKSSTEMVYNGLGGHSKYDTFPTPKLTPPVGSKRPKSMSSINNAKFRKLAPANNKKIDSYLSPS